MDKFLETYKLPKLKLKKLRKTELINNKEGYWISNKTSPINKKNQHLRDSSAFYKTLKD
jgi:hypothetical protein